MIDRKRKISEESSEDDLSWINASPEKRPKNNPTELEKPGEHGVAETGKLLALQPRVSFDSFMTVEEG